MSENTVLVVEVNGDSANCPDYIYDGEVTVRISNPIAENGEPCRGPLSWLNSARITADMDEDAVYCLVSVGDPRGAFCFTVRRLDDGTLIIHTPYPGEGMPHMKTTDLHPGTLQVTGNFSDEPDENEENGEVTE